MTAINILLNIPVLDYTALNQLTAATLETGSYTYQWQSSPDNATWTDISSTKTTGYSPGALTANTFYRRQVTSGDCGTSNSASVLITVYANLVAGTIGTAQTTCAGSTPAGLTSTGTPTAEQVHTLTNGMILLKDLPGLQLI